MELTPEVIKMIKGWLTGNDEADAKSLSRTFRSLRFTIGQWREMIAQCK